MPLIKMELVGLDAASKKLNRIARTSPALVGRALFTSSQSILVPAIRAKVIKNRSVWRGQLAQRISTRVEMRPGKNPSIEVGSIGVPYGLNVEKGSPPTVVPISLLLEYVRKKMGLSGNEAQARAHQIQAKIAKDGAKAHPYLVQTFNDNRKRLVDDTLKRIEAALGRTV